jgi:VanZ family protein
MRLWLPVVLYMILIFGLSSLSNPPNLPDQIGDKGGHSLLYAGLAALVARALGGGLGRPLTLATSAGAVVLATAYGVTDEVHQHFVPGRTMDVMDLVADGIGAAAGAIAVYAWGIISNRHGL